jgi:mannose-6-phosphate isomerase-like protein (cupin superfamily)
MDKINLSQKLSLIKDHWNPRIIGELNGQYLKLVKFQGPFTWHHHETEDEMFLVVKGRFRMEFRECSAETSEPNGRGDVWLEEGEFIIVPRGMEHRPVADEEAEVLLFEPASTLNTGNVQDEFTVPKLEWL